MLRNLASGLTTPPRLWIRVSAWATFAHIVFQFAAVLFGGEGRSNDWSAATIVQTVLTAVLAFGAFRRNMVAVLVLALFGSLRVALFVSMLARMVDGTAIAVTPRLIAEYAVTIPIALLWIVGGISAVRAMQHGDHQHAPGRA